MPNMNILNFPEYMFAPKFLHTIGDIFGKQKQHEMKELSIPRKLTHLVLKKSVNQPRVTILSINCILHWFLWKPKILDNFQSKPHLNISAAELLPDCVF